MPIKENNREEQRKIILSSYEYLSGSSFTRIDGARLLGLTNEGASHMLSTMAEEGLLVRRMVQQRGAKHNGAIHYSKPPTKIARTPWRKLSNRSLGLSEVVL